ncbi:hypothetical protein [Pseudoxanthomonas sp. Soil82]|uniref:hypothetical protein n=1 Tax=Pseudoxanthomonas sp. Soil82 TaxID=3157341 RepID=UPI0033903E5C
MIGELTAAMAALKATNEVIRGVLAADKALSEADLKFRLADAAATLLDARAAVMDAQTAIDARDVEIARLNEALANRAKVVRRANGYYEVDSDGKAVGEAYCQRCYEKDHALYHIAYAGNTIDAKCTCPVCKSTYERRFVRMNPDAGVA